jgi:hypothetical protein
MDLGMGIEYPMAGLCETLDRINSSGLAYMSFS